VKTSQGSTPEEAIPSTPAAKSIREVTYKVESICSVLSNILVRVEI
jgi:hypothetical protein